MTNKLTDRMLRSLTQPKREPVAIFDTEVKQLQVRASVTGVVAFSVLKRPPGSRKLARFPVGTYPLTSLAEARSKARDILREIESGSDPRDRKAEAERIAAAKAVTGSAFADVAEDFITKHVATKRTARNIELIIRRELVPRWAKRPITDIEPHDVVAMVDDIIGRGHPEAAHKTLAYTRKLFRWAVPRYKLKYAPTDHLSGTDLIGPKVIRKRVLNENELRLIWRATEPSDLETGYDPRKGKVNEYMPHIVGSYVRLLLLLGVRRTELGRATWDEFDLKGEAWTIPPTRMKMDEPHVVPLTPTALAILRGLPRRAGDEHGYVLGQAVHYDRARQLIDARIKALNGGKALSRWTLHDLRRTFRTGLSGLKFPPHICEMAIAHGKKGITRVYDQFRYRDEVRAAFEAWEQRLLTIVSPPPAPDGNVVRLRKAS